MDRRDTPQGGRRIAFNPYETGSIVPILQEQSQRTARNNQRYKEGLNQNIEAIRATAENQQFANRQYNQELEKLSKFSQSLNEYFTEEANKRNQREMEEGIALAYQNGISPEEETALERAEEQLEADDAVSQSAGRDALEQTGSYEVSSRVANLSGWRGYGYQIGRASIAGEEYQLWLDSQMSGMTFSTNAEAQEAANRLRMQFMRQNGLIGADVAVLNKYLFPSLRKGESAVLRSVMRDISIEQSAEETQDIIVDFQATRNLSQLIQRLARTRGENGRPIGNAAAQGKAKEILADFIKRGIIDVYDAERLGEQVVAYDEKGRTFNERYPLWIKEAQQIAAQVERQEYNNDQADRKREADQIVDEVMREAIQNPGSFTQADIEALQREYRIKTGEVSPELEDILKNLTASAVEKAQQRKELTALAAAGRLRYEDLRGVAPELALEFRNQIRGERNGQGAARSSSEMNEARKSIIAEIKQARKDSNPDSEVGTETSLIAKEVYDDFVRRLLQFEAGGMNPTDAYQQALQQAMDNYYAQGGDLRDPNRNENGRYYRNDNETRNNYQRILQSNSSRAAEAVGNIANIKQKILTEGREALSTTPELVLTQKELEDMEEDMMNPGYSLPPIVTYLADELSRAGIDTDPYEIIDAQRAAVGLPPLVSPSTEAVNEMTPAGQRLLKKFQSNNRSQRAMAMSQQQGGGGFDPRLVRHGELYQAAGQKYGLDPGLIAAMGEIESGHNPLIESYNGSSAGVMQINKDAHPNFFQNGDWRDPAYNIDYGAQYFKQMLDMFGGDIEAAAMAYNAGPGNYQKWKNGEPISEAVRVEMINHGRKFMKAYSRYQAAALNSNLTMRGDFEIRQIASTDPRYQGDDDPRTLYDPAGHGGDNMHQHYEFATVRQAELAKALYERLGYRVTSHWRPHDHDSAHSHGVAIDVAPPLDLTRTDEAEMDWIDEANAVIGIN